MNVVFKNVIIKDCFYLRHRVFFPFFQGSAVRVVRVFIMSQESVSDKFFLRSQETDRNLFLRSLESDSIFWGERGGWKSETESKNVDAWSQKLKSETFQAWSWS